MAKKNGAFTRDAANGMPALSSTQIATLLTEQRATHGVELSLSGAQRIARITNRAEKGYVKFYSGTFGGQVYPDGATDEKETWLGPGEQMLVPVEVAMHFCGNFLAEGIADRDEIVNRYGGWDYEPIPITGVSGGRAPMNIIGPPIRFPDLLVVQIDQRGREIGEPVAMYERYLDGMRYNPRMRPESETRSVPIEERIAEFV